MSSKKWDPKNLQSEEARFLYQLAVDEGVEQVKHPVYGALLSQAVKLAALIDGDPKAQAKVRQILNRIKEDWQ